MNKKFSRVLALFLACLMLVPTAPLNIFASAVDYESADYLSFSVTSGGNASSGTEVIIYSGSSVVASGATDQNGYVEFMQLDDTQLANSTLAVVGGYEVYGPLSRSLYHVDLTQQSSSLANPELTVSTSSLDMMYGDRTEITVSTNSDAAVNYAVTSGETVVPVDNGVVLALSVGSAVIRVSVEKTSTYAAAFADIYVNVYPADNAIKGFVKGDIPNAEAGKSYSNPVKLADGAEGTVKYSSDNQAFATVDSDSGVVKVAENLLNVVTSARITAVFTPSSANSNYSAMSKSYVISSDCTINWEADDDAWVNSGIISVNTGDDGKDVTFVVDNDYDNVFLAPNGNIDISMDEIPDGEHVITVIIGDSKTDIPVKKDTSVPDFDIGRVSSSWVKNLELEVKNIKDEVSGASRVVFTGKNLNKAINVPENADSVTLNNSDIPDGEYTITVSVFDKAGNKTTKTVDVKKDSTQDILRVEHADNAWLTSDSTVLLTVTNAESDVKSVVASINGEADKDAVAAGENENEYIFDVSKAALSEGTNTVVFTVTDAAGNVSSKIISGTDTAVAESVEFRYDSVAPDFTINSDAWFTDASSSVEISDVTDAASGVKALYYLAKNMYSRHEITVTDGKYSVPLSELYFNNNVASLTVYAVDNAGNETTKTAEVRLDTTAPVIENIVITENNDDTASETANKLTYGYAFKAGIRVTAKVDDPESGIAVNPDSDRLEIKLIATDVNDEFVLEKTPTSYNNGVVTFILSFDEFKDETGMFKGSFAIAATNEAGLNTQVYATDGNSEGKAIISWENIAPHVEVSRPEGSEISVNGETQEWFTYKFDVPVAFNDNHSGVRSYEVKINDDVVYSFVAENADALLTDDKNITVAFNGKDVTTEQQITITVTDHTGNKVNYNIPVEMTSVYTMTITVVDAAGNATVVTESFNATASIDARFNDTQPPIILTWLPETGETESLVRYDTADGIWYNDDITFNISVYDTAKDKDASGIQSVKVEVNGEVLGDSIIWGDDPNVIIARLFEYMTDKESAVSYTYNVFDVKDNNGNEQTAQTGNIYIDDIAPVVDKIYFAEKDDSAPNGFVEIVKDLTFGIFFNNTVTVVVEGSDYGPVGNESFSSGIKEYHLYIGKDAESAKLVGKSADGIFEIDEDDVKNNKVFAVAVDNVDNASEKTVYGENINIDKVAPVVDALDITIPDGIISYSDSETGKVWYSGDVTYKLTVSDNFAGIATVDVYLNNKLILDKHFTADKDKITNPAPIEFSTSEAVVNPDGSINLTYVITDNAGNELTNKTDEFKENNAKYPYTIYMDTTAPGVQKIDFKEIDNQDPASSTVNVMFNNTSNKYEITCDKNTEIKLTISDSGSVADELAPTSGIADKSMVDVTFIPIEGEPFKPGVGVYFNKLDGNGMYEWTYIFPYNFKGNLVVTLKDNVGNSSTNNNPANFTIESQDAHDNEQDHIAMTLDGYSYGVHYNKAVNPVLNFKDEVAGISKIGVKITSVNVSNGQTENRYSEFVTNFSNNPSQYSDILTVEAEDKNYVTKASMPLVIDYEADDITIDIRMYDNAGNVSIATYVFTIDMTAPVINCTLSSSVTPINSYYSSSVTASFVVDEHHFDDSVISLSDGVLSGWSGTGDVRTSSAVYSSDGGHSIVMTVTDKAGNRTTYSHPQFFVDNTDPTITVTDIANNEATNADEVAFTLSARDSLCLATNPLTTSFSVWYKETDPETKEVNLVNKTLGVNDLVNMNFITADPSSSTTEYSYRIDFTKADNIYNDGIYALSCNVTDMSGRTSSTIICQNEENVSESVPSFSFSLNRMGSTYMVKWSDDANTDIADLKKVDGSVTNKPTDIKIQEINPTPVNMESNATKITISDMITPRNVETEASVDTSKKYSVYTYTVPQASYYNKDGKYELRVESADMAGNISDGESKNFIAADFTVDTTSPVIKTELKNSFSMDVDKYRASIEFSDVSDCTIDILLNGETADIYLENTADAKPLKASNYTLSETKTVYIDITDTGNEIQINAKDPINDVTTVKFTNVSVSSNKIALFFAKLESMPWIYLIIVGVPVAIAAIIIIIKKKKNDDFAEEKLQKKDKKAKK